MSITLVINPWFIVGLLIYLLIGVSIVAIHQHNVDENYRKFSTGEAFSWIFLWPALCALYVVFNMN